MQDTSIKGNGTSRFIKGASNFPSSFEEFRRQIVAGTLTADIGLNPAGCDVVGTALSKANLLTDQTAKLLSLTNSATVNEAFEKIAKWKGAVNGLAELGSDGKVPEGQLPPMNYIPTSDRGAYNGVASLVNGKVPEGQLPPMNYIPTSQKNAPLGVPSLDLNKKIANLNLPNAVYKEDDKNYKVTTFNAIDKILYSKISSLTFGPFVLLEIYIIFQKNKQSDGHLQLNAEVKVPGAKFKSSTFYGGMLNFVHSDDTSDINTGGGVPDMACVKCTANSDEYLEMMYLTSFNNFVWRGDNIKTKSTILLANLN